MKRHIQLILPIICIALSGPSLRAVSSYWDGNGATAGAGTAPTGTWGIDAFWSIAPGGAVLTTPWIPGNTAVFSAGADATDPFTVTVDGNQIAGGITFEEGVPTISGGTITMNAPDFPIIANTNATIASTLEGSGIGFKKTGTGTLTLGGTSSYDGTNTIAEGVVVITSVSALGNTLIPTIVSNGATLQLIGAVSPASERVILNGNGFNGLGALRGPSVNATWSGGAVLGSDASIYNGGGGTWTWATAIVDGTAGGSNFNLTVGGDVGTTRFNINANPGIRLGTGTMTKEGTSTLQFEVPSSCSAFYFNGGHVRWRNNNGAGTGPIYVGVRAGEFRTGGTGPNVALPNPIVLASGANPVFAPSSNFTFTVNGAISGPGGLSKGTNSVEGFPGTLFLNNTNTYTGSTIILGGILTLNTNGSIANSAVIDVQSTNSIFNVSSNLSGFVLGAAQRLKGDGTVQGNVTSAGTLSPGASVGNLIFSDNLTFSGNLLIDVDKSLPSSNDVITVAGTLMNTGSGTVTVANLGPALTAGDSFQLFSKPVANGQALNIVSAGGGVVWTNKLAQNGSIAVVSASVVSAPATNLTIMAVNPTSFKLGGRGAANSSYNIYAFTNVTTPVTNWWLIGTTNSDAGGVIQFLDQQATNAQRFYRFGQ